MTTSPDKPATAARLGRGCFAFAVAVLLGLSGWAMLAAAAQTASKRPVRPKARDDSSLLDRLSPQVSSPAKPADASQPRQAPTSKDLARIEPSAEAMQAEKPVRDAGYLTIDHGYAAGGTEAALRGPSLVPPKNQGAAYQLLPIEIATTVEADGSGALVLPCPRDVIDQVHLACVVSVVRIRDGAEQTIPHKSRVVYSEAAEQDGYVNPFVYVDLNHAQADGPLEVRALHWLAVGDYPAARQHAAAFQAATTTIQGPIDRAAVIEYDIELQIDEAGKNPTRGDCSVKAYIARDTQLNAPGVRIEIVEGYRYRLPSVDRQTGGCHFQNLVIGPAGLFMFDATTPHDYYVGLPLRFITTSVGGEFVLPALDDPPGTMHRGSNLGFYSGFKSHGKAQLSTPTFGQRAEALAELNRRPPPTIARYAAALWQARVHVYARPGK